MKGPESIQSTADSILANPYASIQFAFDKRRRNLEKRKSRLLQYEADLRDGKKLSEQQIEARYCIGEVDTQLEFLKDIGRTVASLHKDYLRNFKQRDDGFKREQVEGEQKRLEDFICYQNVIEHFCKEEVKEAFTNGINNAVKTSEEELKVVENLADAFGLTLIGGEGFLECREKSEEGAKLAHRILVGSKEKVMDNFSGAQIRELFEKIINCGFMLAGAEDQSVKSDQSVLESENEQPRDDPKVVFVQVTNGSSENFTGSEINEACNTEFGFEGCGDSKDVMRNPKMVVRDPPPPIPLPVAVSEDPANRIIAGEVWVAANAEAKPGASKRRVDGPPNGLLIQQANGFMNCASGERRQMHDDSNGRRQLRGNGNSDRRQNRGDSYGDRRQNRGAVLRVGYGSGIGENGCLECVEDNRAIRSTRRPDREGYDGRNQRGAPRNNNRGFSAQGNRGVAPNFAQRGGGYRNGGNNSGNGMNGGYRSNGNRGGAFNGYGYGYNPPPPRRQLGFNFAPADAY